MMMPTVSLEAARDCLRRHRAGESWTAHHYVRWTGEGERWAEFNATEVLQDLKAIMRKIDRYPLPKSMGQNFEAPASAVVHEKLRIPTAFAGSRDFWLWLTFAASEGGFVEIVDWRFGGDTIGDGNYGIGTLSMLREGLLARLWWRGYRGRHDFGGEVYGYARMGSVDLWRSHFIRPEIGRCQKLVEAFLRAKHPHGDTAKAALTIEEERALAKRLTMLNATICFEALDNVEIDGMITGLVEEIRHEEVGKRAV